MELDNEKLVALRSLMLQLENELCWAMGTLTTEQRELLIEIRALLGLGKGLL